MRRCRGDGRRRRAGVGALAAAVGLFAAFHAGTAIAEPGGQIHDDAESVEPLPIGAQVPSVQVRSIDGTSVDLARLTAEQGALLVFYRGGW